MKERRQYHRFNVQINALFSASASRENLSKGTVLNMSAMGLSMTSKEKLDLGQEISIQLELPGPDKVTVMAKVVYSNPTGVIGEFRNGIRIHDRVSDDAQKFLKFYADKLKNYPEDLTD